MKSSSRGQAAKWLRSTGGAHSNSGFQYIEPLEQRTFLSVSQDSSGWTVVGPSVDTRTVYVSSSLGDDANSGLSPDAPLASLWKAKSLLRDGMPDWLLLKRGDVWQESLGFLTTSGRSADEPLLISAYGDPSRPRPRLETGDDFGLRTMADPVDHVALVGVHFKSGPTRTASPAGLSWLAPTRSLLIEDSVFEGYANNITLQRSVAPGDDPATRAVSNVTIRRSVVRDAYSADTHSQGVFAKGVSGLLLEENLIDHNGWSETVAGAGPTIFNHNVYVQYDSTNVVLRGNVIARASSHGVQLRSGGVVEGNAFVANPIGLLLGTDYDALHPTGGAIVGNVFLDGNDIGALPRGMAIDVQNTGAGLLIADNVLSTSAGVHPGHAIRLLGTTGAGVHGVSVLRNVLYDWEGGLRLVGGTPAELGGVRVESNTILAPRGLAPLVNLGTAASVLDAGMAGFAANAYGSGAADPSGWFRVEGLPHTLAQWQALSGEADARQASPDEFPDPTRDAGSYHAALGGGAGDLSAYLDALARQSAADWRPAYTAAALVDYVRLGFGLEPLVVDTEAPQAIMPYGSAVRMVRGTSVSPKTGYRFTVVYADDGSLNAATLKTGNLLITGPDGYNQLPSFVSSKTRSDGSILAEYRFNPPGGAWDMGDNSMYKLRLGPDPVQDLAGNATQTGSLGTIIVYLTESADQPLTTIGLKAAAVTESTVIEATSTYTFKVTYLPHEYGVRSGSIGDGDVVVVNDKGFSGLATLVSKKRGSKPGSIVAKYQIKPPGGTWSGGDSATYTIVLRKREVRDVEGHYVPAGKLGRFKVSLASGGQVVITPQPIASSDRVVLGLAYTSATEDLFNSEKPILAA